MAQTQSLFGSQSWIHQLERQVMQACSVRISKMAANLQKSKYVLKCLQQYFPARICPFSKTTFCFTGTPKLFLITYHLFYIFAQSSGHSNPLPLVPGGYIAPGDPLFHPLSPQLHAKRLALGTGHAVLQCADGTIYTWGSGR